MACVVEATCRRNVQSGVLAFTAGWESGAVLNRSQILPINALKKATASKAAQNSLNVSSAATLLMYEVVRDRVLVREEITALGGALCQALVPSVPIKTDC